jgi:hypothetical protein
MRHLWILSSALLVFSVASAKPPTAFHSLIPFCQKSQAVRIDFEKGLSLNHLWRDFTKGLSLAKAKDVVVFEINELPGVHVAVFRTLAAMNSVLGRPTVYLTEGEIVDHLAATDPLTFDGYVGHDLEESLLKRFSSSFAKLEKKMRLPKAPSEKTEWLCKEASFWRKFIQPKMAEQNQFVLIAGSMEYFLKPTISHEIHHAIFYRNTRLQRLVENFWSTRVTPRDRRQIKKILTEYNYDVYANRKLLLNEFLAYLMQSEAENDILSAFVKKYRGLLAEDLTAHHFRLPKI